MARRTSTVYDSPMIGRRQFLAALPALAAGLGALRTTSLPAPPRIALSGPWEGLEYYTDDGTISNHYSGVERDAYTAYLTHSYGVFVVRPGETPRRISNLL